MAASTQQASSPRRQVIDTLTTSDPLNILTDSSSSLQKQAIDKARAAISQLPHGDQVFQACVDEAQTILEVVESLSRQRRSYQQKRFTRLLEKFQRHTLWLQNMSGAVDVVVQANTGIGCPLWAPIKYVLLVSNNHARAAEGILKMIDTISDNLPRLEIYLRLQPDPHLDVSLLNVFTSVVEFSVKAFQYFGLRSRRRLFGLMRFPFKEQFGDILDQLRRHSREADDNARAIEMSRNAEFRNEAAMSRCQEWLKPLNVREIHDSQRRSRLEGTCEWIWANPDFIKWSTQSSSQALDRVLCVYGPHGCGKSVLASSIAEGFQRKQLTTLFYSFSGMDADRQSINGLIRTFLWQLLQGSSDEKRLEIVLNLMRSGPPGIGELWDTLQEVVAIVPGQVYCIVDGVDECSDPIPNLLDLCKLFAARESTHAIIFGRPQGLRNALASTAMAIEINQEIIKHDIERFIDTKIRESKIPTLMGDLEDTVSRSLKSNSDCMFLWANLMIDELSRSTTPFHVRERLRNLPRGLEEAYRHLLLQLLKRLDPLDIGLAQRVFAFTAVACRTLDLKEVQHACALDSLSSSAQADLTLDDHLLPHPEKAILEVCGDFISITDGLVRFVHFSVQEFLTRPEGEWSGDNDRLIASFRVDAGSSHLRLGSTCLDFLTMSDYAPPSGDASYEEVMARYPFLMYASIYAISHLSQLGTPCPATLARLWSFIRSGKCVPWMEYAGVIHMESGSFEMLLEDLGRISLWPGGEQLVCLPALFRQELARRVQEFGEQDPCTNRWRLIVDTFQPLESSLPVLQLESDTPTTAPEPRLIPGTTLQDLAHIIDGMENNLMLPLDRQVSVVLRLQSYLSRVNVLTDSLKTLFRMILQNASVIPIYGLIVIADFYHRVNKLEEALEVYSTALKRTEGQKVRTRPEILAQVGGILQRQGKHKDAEAACTRALKEGERIWGVGHANTLAYASGLASVLYSEERFAEAGALYERTLTGREKALGTDHLDTLVSANNLANALYSQSKPTEAEALYRRALTGGEKVLGADHQGTLIFADNLRLVLLSQGRFAEAEALHRRALTGRNKVLGADHPDTLASTTNLAGTLYSQDKFSEAEVLYRRALTGREKALGADHLDTLLSANNLADALYSQGKFAEAEALERRALSGREKVQGANHLGTLASASYLAGTLYSQGKFLEAEALGRRVLTGREKALAADHLDTLASASYLARTLYIQGKFAEVEILEQRALTGREKALGADHLDTLASASNLAAALYRQGRFAEAEVLHCRALTGREVVLGADHVDTLLSANNLGKSLYSQGKFAEAETLHRRALTGREKALVADHLDTLVSAADLADTLYTQGKFARAEALYWRALTGREKALGADHLDTLVSANSLANALYRQGKLSEAEALHLRALTGREKALGVDKLDTLVSANNLGTVQYSQGKFAEAEVLGRRALIGREKALGASHLHTLTSTRLLAASLYNQGKFAEAEALNRRALSEKEEALGVDHLDTLTSASHLAATLYSQGKLTEAELLERRALTGREKALGAGHPDTLTSASNLAVTLYSQGEPAEAEALHQRALTGREKALGAGHLDTLNSTSYLALTLYIQGRFAEAEALEWRALTGREKALGAGHPDTLTSATNLAGTLYSQDKFSEAEVLYRRALTGREKVLGADHLDTLDSANGLAKALCSQGNFAEAEVLHRRAFTGREKALGADHLDSLVSASNLAGTLYGQCKYAEAEALGRRVLTGSEKALGAGHRHTLGFAKNLALVLRSQGKFAEAEVLHQRTPTAEEQVLGRAAATPRLLPSKAGR